MTTFAGKSSHLEEVQESVDGIGTNAQFKGGIDDLAISADDNVIYFVDRDDHSLGTISVSDAKVTTHIRTLRGWNVGGPFSKASINFPQYVASYSNDLLFFTTTGISFQGGAGIFLADFSQKYVHTVVAATTTGYKDGNGNEAQFNGVSGIATTSDGKTLYISDISNHLIRKIVR